MTLIIGLGNPGKKYEKTRHNIGFEVIDNLESIIDNFSNWKKSNKNNCLFAKGLIAGKKIEIIKPLLFMNNSGKVVKKITQKHKLKNKNILVIHDDIDLPLGKIKIVKNRGSAGHKGIESIIKELNTNNFFRFRLGIGPKPQAYKQNLLEKFVLQKFNKNEEKIIEKLIKTTIEAIELFLKESPEKAMSKFN